MSNFVFSKEHFILIHIPKCGGLSIREYCFKDSPKLGPFFGAIPTEYSKFKKIAIIRNPYTRFISTYHMFKYGTDVFKPIFNGTLKEFIDIVCDDNIFCKFTDKSSIIKGKASIRHHALPQTDPYNCLHLADYVCAFENYEKEIENIFHNILGISSFRVQQKNVSQNKKKHIINGSNLVKINEFYKEDFKKLNYSMYKTNVCIDKGIAYEYSG